MAEQARMLRGEFKKTDARGDNTLDFNEMAHLIRRGNAEISTSELRRLFDSVEKTSEGRIDFGDLVDYIFQDILPMPAQGNAANSQKYSKKNWDSVRDVLSKVYGPDTAEAAMVMLMDVVKQHDALCQKDGISQEGGDAIGTNDATLITYANTFEDKTGSQMPIRCLSQFLQRYNVASTMKCIHMLPMFPWDTDRGFSVKDYYQVDPRYGEWEDVTELSTQKCGNPVIMFDYVCNHASIENPWVQGALMQRHLPESHPMHRDVQQYKDFVTAYADEDGPAEQQKPSDETLSKLTRPRAHPPLTPYFVVKREGGQSASAHVGTPEVDGPPGMGRVLGKGYVWTTFSRGKNAEGKEQTKQVDLNYRNIQVLSEVVRVLLFYVRKGSTIIRLDAIGYIWKVLGSNSIHERGTHMLLAILYKVLRLADPRVMTVAEVNEPVSKCLGYLGSEQLPESNMVYNFAPFPMALHAQIVKDVQLFSNFLGTMGAFKGRQFITVLGSHDGLAQKQVREILPPEELERLHRAFIDERDGHVNWAFAPGGKKIVYEVCGTPWCLVNGTVKSSKEPFEVQLARYINALCMGLLPRGMPGVYAQGLIGAENYNPPEGIDEYRTLNRESFDINKLFQALDEPDSREGATFRAVQGVMGKRAAYPHFDRRGPEPKVLRCLDPAVLAVQMGTPDPDEPPMVVLINVANEKKVASVGGLPRSLLDCKLRDALEGFGGKLRQGGGLTTQTSALLKSKSMEPSWKADLNLDLAPYEVVWLVREGAGGHLSSTVPRSLHTGLGQQWEVVREVVAKVYGGDSCETAMLLLKDVVREHAEICQKEGMREIDPSEQAVTFNDATLIAYANTFHDSSGEHMPIGALSQFLQKYSASDAMKCIHMLPMFPWDTDRGFSVMDYYKVDPRYGTWDDVSDLSTEKNGSPTIMFDYVCNHVSISNPWAQGALLQRHLAKDHPMHASVQKYKDFVTAYADEDGPAEQQKPSDEMLSKLTRPRAFPPLTPYFVAETDNGQGAKAAVGKPETDAFPGMGRIIGKGYVWTTFSRGRHKTTGVEQTKQVDLNYRNPNVLAEVVRVLLFYVRKGSTIIRLDAIGYIWKVLGSNSIHERGTHMLLAILYKVLRLADPRVMTVAEVNEPVSKCLGYLGSEKLPESNMVYNFAPFPMALHAQIIKDVSHFAGFLGTMGEFKGRQFITVLGSHDGLAQKQVREILPPEELERLHSAFINERHGHCNFAFASGGKKIVYEVCGTPWCLVNGPQEKSTEPFNLQLARYINALCLGLIPKGMPGVYAQGLLGAENYHPPDGLDEYRTLNRESFDIQKLFPRLDDPSSREGSVFRAVQDVMCKRASYPHFDRRGAEPEVIQCANPSILAVVLQAPESTVPPMVVLANVADETRKCEVAGMPSELVGTKLADALEGVGGLMRNDALHAQSKASAADVSAPSPGWSPELTLELAPYEVLWLVKQETRKAGASKGRRSIMVRAN